MFVAAAGALLCLVFTATTLKEFLEFRPLTFENLFAAVLGAAWRLKWTLLPAAIVALWISARQRRRIARAPERFAGLRLAHAGLVVSALVFLTTVAAIGVTIPKRLESRQLAREAATRSLLYASHRAVLDYRIRFGTYPATLEDLRRLPDPDGVIAMVLREFAPDGYKPSAMQAATRPNKPELRGARARIRSATLRPGADDTPNEEVSFTNYELIWPGPDGILGTEDDRRIRDGLLVEATAPADTNAPAAASPSRP